MSLAKFLGPIRGAVSLALLGTTLVFGAPAKAGDSLDLLSGVRTEVGSRLWVSAPHLDNRLFDPDGTPASRLVWDGSRSASAEAFFRFDFSQTGLFIKGFAGGGLSTGGSLDDEDYAFNFPLPGGGTFSGTFLDTYMEGAREPFGYAAADIGWTVPRFTSLPMSLGFFVGGFGSVDRFMGRGVRCNADDAQNLFCPLGVQVVPLDTDVIAHETRILGARLGVETKVALNEVLDWRIEAAYLAAGTFKLDDSHLLRTQTPDPSGPPNENALGPAPNIVSKSDTLTGVQLETELAWRFAPQWTASLGARYWHFDSGSAPVVFGARLPAEFQGRGSTDKNTLDRLGVFTGISYRF